jgi:hypothetical protein
LAFCLSTSNTLNAFPIEAVGDYILNDYYIGTTTGTFQPGVLNRYLALSNGVSSAYLQHWLLPLW